MRRLCFSALILLATYSAASASEPAPDSFFIDLQPRANQVFTETLSDIYPDSHLAELPQGEQKLGAATFKIGPGCILLGSTIKTTKPAKVEIPVKRKFAKLYMLH